MSLSGPVCLWLPDGKKDSDPAQELLGDGRGMHCPPFPVCSLLLPPRRRLQFTLQSLVTSPPQVCPADLAAWCPQDRETVTKEVAPVCPRLSWVPAGLAWPSNLHTLHLSIFKLSDKSTSLFKDDFSPRQFKASYGSEMRRPYFINRASKLTGPRSHS